MTTKEYALTIRLELLAKQVDDLVASLAAKLAEVDELKEKIVAKDAEIAALKPKHSE